MHSCHRVRTSDGDANCWISAIESFAARVSGPVCRSSFSCDPTVRLRDRGAWVQHRCSAGRMCCAQMPPDSQCDGAGNCQISATEAFAASANCSLLYAVHEAAAAVFENGRGTRVRQSCLAGRVLCAQLRHQIRRCGGAAKCSILSAIEAFAARVSCPGCRSSFTRGPLAFERDHDARVPCAQLLPNSQR